MIEMLGANESPLREVVGRAANFHRANRRGARRAVMFRMAAAPLSSVHRPSAYFPKAAFHAVWGPL